MWAAILVLFCLFAFYFLLELSRAHGWARAPLSRTGYGALYGALAGADGEPTYEQLLALGEAVGEVRAGLRPRQIDVVLAPAAGGAGGGCPICLDEIGKGVALLCACRFHRPCISKWLAVKASCPTCREVFR